MNPKFDIAAIDANPFDDMKISKWDMLDSIRERSACSNCHKSRKYFCYTCYIPVEDLQGRIPHVKLPIKIDIIKHAREIDGKSTAAHAAVLAPDDVTIYTYPDIPDYGQDEKIVLVYPGKGATSVEKFLLTKYVQNITCDTLQTPNSEFKFPITRAVFIDSTWNQSKGLYNDTRLRALPCVVLQSRLSQFWRHQKGSPRWYLATVEAIHQFLVELCIALDSAYDGQFDNLLFFFRYMYDKIHSLYPHKNLLAYKRRLT